MTPLSLVLARIRGDAADMKEYASRLGTSPEGFIAAGYADAYATAAALVEEAARPSWRDRRRWRVAREVRRNR